MFRPNGLRHSGFSTSFHRCGLSTGGPGRSGLRSSLRRRGLRSSLRRGRPGANRLHRGGLRSSLGRWGLRTGLRRGGLCCSGLRTSGLGSGSFGACGLGRCGFRGGRLRHCGFLGRGLRCGRLGRCRLGGGGLDGCGLLRGLGSLCRSRLEGRSAPGRSGLRRADLLGRRCPRSLGTGRLGCSNRLLTDGLGRRLGDSLLRGGCRRGAGPRHPGLGRTRCSRSAGTRLLPSDRLGSGRLPHHRRTRGLGSGRLADGSAFGGTALACRLSGCRLSGCRLSGCRLSGCRLSGCRLSDCRPGPSRLTFSRLGRSRLGACPGWRLADRAVRHLSEFGGGARRRGECVVVPVLKLVIGPVSGDMLSNVRAGEPGESGDPAGPDRIGGSGEAAARGTPGRIVGVVLVAESVSCGADLAAGFDARSGSPGADLAAGFGARSGSPGADLAAGFGARSGSCRAGFGSARSGLGAECLQVGAVGAPLVGVPCGLGGAGVRPEPVADERHLIDRQVALATCRVLRVFPVPVVALPRGNGHLVLREVAQGGGDPPRTRRTAPSTTVARRADRNRHPGRTLRGRRSGARPRGNRRTARSLFAGSPATGNGFHFTGPRRLP
ncbi:pentapeptide repeat-containing protein [Actinoplanes lobatus]|uniref:pentapeptide repeat-containing protein n=1 Tax=Actinoplanes lobatus TaxID=113568 RepID=UPI0038996B4D